MLNIILNKTISIRVYVLIIVILLIGAVVILSIFNLNKSLSHSSVEYSRLEGKYDTCKESVSTLQKTVRDYEQKLKDLPVPSYVKFKNILNPPGFIKKELLNHPEIIPFEGVLGGTMTFLIPENILILNNKWIYAGFEDGHIGGDMLIEYKVSKDSVITWKVIDASSPYYE